MHDLGQTQLEQTGMYEQSPEHTGEYYESPYETEFPGESSPLQEILEGEGMGEGPYETYEAPYPGEGMFETGHEGPYEEGLFEGPPYETAYQETFETPYETSYEAPLDEYPGEMYGEAGEMYGEAGEMYGPAGEMYGEAGEMYGESQEFGEDEELALTAELLEIQTEEELDQFLGKLARRVGRGLRRAVRAPVFRAVGGVLRRVARQYVLPMAGRAIGGMIGGPAGVAAGGWLAGQAGRALGLEVEGMSNEEANFAVGRQYVRLAMDAARRAAMSPPTSHPAAVARRAMIDAARQHAPGLLSPSSPRIPVGPLGGRRRGIWVRRGATITLFGV